MDANSTTDVLRGELAALDAETFEIVDYADADQLTAFGNCSTSSTSSTTSSTASTSG